MMLLSRKSYKFNRLLSINQKLKIAWIHCSMQTEEEIERIVRVISDHPFPDQPLHPTLRRQIPPSALSTPFVENVLGNLFGAHSNGLKAYEFFEYCLASDVYVPSSDAFEKTLHILTRMRYFERAWQLIARIKKDHPSLLTLKSMSIILSRIAKFRSYEETIEAFEKMEEVVFSGKKFGTNEFNVLLRAFCTQRQMKEARSVFQKMYSQFPPNTKTMNILLLGFKESGDITAVELFYHEMVKRGFKPNNITYNIRIDAYCKKGRVGDALRLLEEMESAGCSPSLETITTVIHGAGLARNIFKAKDLFKNILERSLKPDTGAYNALLSSLIRSKDVITASKLMKEMEEKNIKCDNVTYHTMLLGLMRSDGVDSVLNLHTKMVERNFVPKTQTVVMLMKFFCENGMVDLGLDLWDYLVKKGHCPHSHALDLLVTGLCARGRVEESCNCCKQMVERGRAVSERVLQMLERCMLETGETDRIEELKRMMKKLKLLLPPSVALKIFASKGHLSKAFRTFSLIQGHASASASCDFIADSLSSLLLSCTNLKLLREGKQLHAQIITWGLHKSRALVPKLVSYYTAFGFLDDAHFIVANTNILSPIPWNILISSCVNKGCFEKAIYTYKEMCCKRIRPDSFTYPSVLKACAELLNLDFGREVHRSINASAVSSDLYVQNALVSMYGKCGDLETARNIFNRMSVKDDVSWNSIISEYASRGMWDEAFKLFESMRAAGVELTIITWNTVAGGCLQTGNFKGALELTRHMRLDLGSLDPVAVITGLGACSHLCALKLGKEIHGLAIRNSFVDYDNVKNSLISFYSRCGDLTRACIVFRSTEANNISTWNSMISGFAIWDRSEEAGFLFRELLLVGLEPNYVTLACILPLCARLANLKHGKELHCYITRHGKFQQYQLLWNALVDIYARSGQVLVARRLFDLLDKRDAVTYTSLIAGYGIQGDGQISLKLFQEMIQSQIKPDDIAIVAALSACSHSGLVAEGQLLFERMQTDYGVTPRLEHFYCIADLYGRAGLLTEAKEIILRMPYKPTAEMWATLIGACRIHYNTDIGAWAAERLMELKPQHSGYYVLIANMYAAAGRWNKLIEVRTFMRGLGVRKDPGCAWIDIGAGFSPFVVEDTWSNQADEIFLLLEGLTKQMKDADCVPCANSELGKEFLLDWDTHLEL